MIFAKKIYWPFSSALVPLSVLSFAILFSSYVKIGGKVGRRIQGNSLSGLIEKVVAKYTVLCISVGPRPHTL